MSISVGIKIHYERLLTLIFNFTIVVVTIVTYVQGNESSRYMKK